VIAFYCVAFNRTDDKDLRVGTVRTLCSVQAQEPNALIDDLEHQGGGRQITVHGPLPQRRLPNVESVQLKTAKVIDGFDLPFTECLVDGPVC
jgi:hypothetical protein